MAPFPITLLPIRLVGIYFDSLSTIIEFINLKVHNKQITFFIFSFHPV
jgi:hypothetical protein